MVWPPKATVLLRKEEFPSIGLISLLLCNALVAILRFLAMHSAKPSTLFFRSPRISFNDMKKTITLCLFTMQCGFSHLHFNSYLAYQYLNKFQHSTSNLFCCFMLFNLIICFLNIKENSISFLFILNKSRILVVNFIRNQSQLLVSLSSIKVMND